MSFEAVAYVFKNCKYQPMTKPVLGQLRRRARLLLPENIDDRRTVQR